MNYPALLVLNATICIESLFLIYSIQRRGVSNRIHQAFKLYLLFVALTAFVQFELGMAQSAERFLFWKGVMAFPILTSVAQSLLLVFYVGSHRNLNKSMYWMIVLAGIAIFAMYRIFLLPDYAEPCPWGFRSIYHPGTWNANFALLVMLTFLELTLAAIFVYKEFIRGERARDVGTRLFFLGLMLPPLYRLFAEGFNMWSPFIPLPLRGTDIYLIVDILFYVSINGYDVLDPSLSAVSTHVTDTIQDGLVLTDMDDAITYANPAFLSMTGLPYAAALERKIDDCFIARKLGERAIASSKPARDKPLEMRQLVLYSESSLKGIFVDIAGSLVLSKSGMPLGIVYIVRDVSDAKRNDERRRHIADVLQHDLKSRLVGILHLEEMRAAGDGEGNRGIDNSIMNGLGDTLIRIDSYLVADRMESGSYMVQVESLDLRSLLLDSTDYIREAMRGKNLRFEFGAADSEPDRVETDRFLLSVLFRSLISNAAQAAPPGSAISVSVETRGGDVNIMIHNYGAVPEPIRDDFMRTYVDSAKGAGHGIGAFGARFITEELGGAVGFQSSEAAGTTIIISLPRSIRR